MKTRQHNKKGGSSSNQNSGPISNSVKSSSPSTSAIKPGIATNFNHMKTNGMSYNFGSFFQFMSIIGPFVLIGFFILTSLFNQNIKGFVYFLGIPILLILSAVFSSYIKLSEKENNPVCSMFGISFMGRTSIPFSTLVYAYTLAYMLIPMYMYNVINIPLLIFICLLCGADSIIVLSNRCSNMIAIALAIIIGLLAGMILSSAFTKMNPDVMFHTDLISDKLACSVPSEQKFKCRVYKNGELISTMTK
jgi:hypothetical protein